MQKSYAELAAENTRLAKELMFWQLTANIAIVKYGSPLTVPMDIPELIKEAQYQGVGKIVYLDNNNKRSFYFGGER
jgi:hypothetical protein